MRGSPVPILSVLRPWTERMFRKKLEWSGDCLVYLGYRIRAGYGLVEVTGRLGEGRYPILAHRLAWALENGIDPPADKIVCHRCNNPSCCNPKHLYLGTHQDNADDMVMAGHQSRVLLGVKGVRHPAARHSQEVRDRVIGLRREAMPWREIIALTGVPRDTCSRWWQGWLKAGQPATF